MKHSLYHILLTIALLSMAFSSCKKLVEIDPPKNQLITSEVFEDSADATSAVVGIYTNIMKGLTSLGFGNGALTVYTGFSADEIYPTTNIASEKEFYDNDISAVNNNLNSVSLWKFAYQLIYQANACIEGLEESKTLNQSTKNQLLGEAKFSRALFYFNLVNLYGDVPLITSTDFSANAVLPRTPYAKVYEQIVKDLTEAAAMLSTGYVTTNRVRPNRFAALALLSRVYLYLQQWDEAEKTSSEVINSGMYSLEPDLNDVFLPGSRETIWAMIPLQPGFETAEGFRFIPGSVSFVPKCVITDQLLDAFDSTDKRRQQ